MGRFQLAPDSVPLLLQLASPVKREEVLDRVCRKSGIARERLAEIFDTLVSGGILMDVQTDVSQASEYSNFFGNLLNHRGMLADTLRMAQFEQGIAQVVSGGATVIDVGAGSGILSMFAARAGASRVFALEESRIIDDARALAEANGFSGIIEFIGGDAANFRTAEPVDLVMGEWMGMFLFDEWRHFETFAKVRDQLLKPDGQVLPRSVQFYLVPIDDRRLYEQCGLGFWERPVSGFDYTLGRQRQLERLQMSVVQADHHTFASTPWEILNVDCRTGTVEAFFFERTCEQVIKHACCIDGFIGYFNLELAPGIHLSTSPSTLPTHWRQAYLPIERISLQPGDIVTTSFRSAKHPRTGGPRFGITVAHSRGAEQLHRASYQY
ncbi:MAG: methyltransferase domain-containing protein [Verrucomicrobiae bacterium]|nr:methyltransferase domain-containing protein [Verrucomicrobiae bacterium]